METQVKVLEKRGSRLENMVPDQEFRNGRVRDPRRFSAEFASSVTTASLPKNVDWIAKNGSESLYALLQEIFPQVWNIITCTRNQSNFVSLGNPDCDLADYTAKSSSKPSQWESLGR